MDIDKSPETLKIVHLNICGLKNKINETRNFVIRENIDILGLSETHLKIEESAPHIPNYTWYGNNYSSNSKGIGFYIRNKIRKQEMIQVPTNFKEKERIAIVKLENLTLIEIYAPVESDTENNRKEFYLALSEITANYNSLRTT
jgi:exonuclease III